MPVYLAAVELRIVVRRGIIIIIENHVERVGLVGQSHDDVAGGDRVEPPGPGIEDIVEARTRVAAHSAEGDIFNGDDQVKFP